MKAKELKYYKPLDITQLSGSPWNDAEKVLGLDQDDKVIMAEPEETVTPEYVDDAINQAMEAETARTESTYLKQSDIDGDQFPTKNWVKGHTALAIEHSMEDETARTESTYAKKSEIPDMDDYYTKEQVDDLIDDIDVSDQLANYALTTAVTADIQTAIANETARTESTYAKPADIPSLDNYYNKSQVDEKVSGAESYADSIVEGLATETYVDDAIAAIPPVDLSGYAKTTAVTQDIQTAIAAETARTESTYLKQSDIDDDQYPTKNWVKGHTALAIQHSMEEETARTENTYAKIADIPSLDGYATEQYVDDAIAAIPSVDLSPYAKTTAVTEDINTAMAAETARTESTYLKEHQSLADYSTTSQVQSMIASAKSEVEAEIPVNVGDLANDAGYITSADSTFNQFFNGVQYDSQTKRINFFNRNNTVAGYIDATDFIKDGMVDNVYITGSTLVISFNTDAGQEDIEIALTDIFNPNNYYDKTAVDGMFASETARTEATYLKEHQDISGKLDKTDFNTYTGATETALAEKLDASAYTVDNAMSSASTNPVENKVIYDVLNGVTATTELTITNTDSDWRFTDGYNNFYHFKDTSISKYKAVYLGNLAVTGLSSFSLYIVGSNNNWMYMNPGDIPTTSNVGTIKYYVSNSGYGISFRKSSLDGTFEYYILFDTEKMYFIVYKTLPASITTVSDHKANVSDVPVAQDKSDTKFFVYDNVNGNGKRVVAGTSLNNTYQFSQNYRRAAIQVQSNYWSGDTGVSTMNPTPGNEVVGGIKTSRDSVIINNAASALNGFTEQITLTLGNQSATDYAYLNWGNRYLYETDDPRYEVIPVSASTDANYTYFSNVSLSGNTYYIENPITSFYDYSYNGRYELSTLQNSGGYLCIRGSVSGHNYLIIDKELLTVELSATLTITRTKNLNGAFVEPKDLTGGTETIIQTLEVGGDSTGTTLTIHYDNGKNVIDYTYPLKETNAGYLLVYDVSSYFNSSYYSVLSVSDNNTVYYPVTDGDEMIGRPNLVFDLSTTQTGQLKFSYDDYNWLVYNAIDHTLTFTSSLPTWSETVQTTGILDDYWTTGETQSAITAATQGMVTSGDVATQIGTAMASETARTESTYAKLSQIPSLSGYATETWVQNQGYLTQHQSLAEYYTKTEIDGMIGDIESLLASI